MCQPEAAAICSRSLYRSPDVIPALTLLVCQVRVSAAKEGAAVKRPSVRLRNATLHGTRRSVAAKRTEGRKNRSGGMNAEKSQRYATSASFAPLRLKVDLNHPRGRGGVLGVATQRGFSRLQTNQRCLKV